MSRRAGTIFFTVNGTLYDAKGNYEYNLGQPKREAIVGADRVHGYKEMPQVPYIAGEITDNSDLDLQAFLNLTDATVTLELANGKVFALRDAFYAGDGTANTEDANIQVRFEGERAEEIR
jgi:predicted heme/steroid binding protein